MDRSGCILLKTDKDDEWVASFRENRPALDIRCWPDVGNAQEIDYALLWNPPEELFTQLNNLKVIFSIGAGIDGILKVNSRPAHLPLVRLSDKMLTDAMVEYVIYSVLRIHRNMPDYDRMQKQKHWGFFNQVAAADCRIGVMGLGLLGGACVKTLKAIGYTVSGFSRSLKSIEGVQCFDQSQLNEFLQQTDILVCLLPLTDATRHILNQQTFAQLPKGASIINAGRGGHLHENDLIPALDSGQLRHAVLDVFESEPLPQDHPFWLHPDITLTPHIASQTVPASAVNHIIDGIERHQQGKPLKSLYDPALGY